MEPEPNVDTTTDRILAVLAAGDASATELARSLGVHRSIIDRQVDRMVTAGVLVRSAHVGAGIYEVDTQAFRVPSRRYRYSI